MPGARESPPGWVGERGEGRIQVLGICQYR